MAAARDPANAARVVAEFFGLLHRTLVAGAPPSPLLDETIMGLCFGDFRLACVETAHKCAKSQVYMERLLGRLHKVI